MSKKTRNIVIAVCLLIVLVVGALLIYNANRPQAQLGDKNIVVTVVHKDESSKDFAINTGAENLRTACEEQELIAGDESEYGLYVKVVDGETADYDADGAYWAITKDGEWLTTGVDDTMIADGDHYEFTYTPAA